MASKKKYNSLGDVLDQEKKEKERKKEIEEIRSSFRDEDRIASLSKDARDIVINNRRIASGTMEGESTYRNMDNIGTKYIQEEKPKTRYEQLRDNARMIIDSGAIEQNRARNNYLASLSDTDQAAFKRVEASNGVYSSPYMNKGREGKSDLIYKNANWNLLSKEEKERYFDLAEQGVTAEDQEVMDYWEEMQKRNDETLFYDNNDWEQKAKERYDNDMVDYARRVLEGNEDEYDYDAEIQWMFNMLPDEVKTYLSNNTLPHSRNAKFMSAADVDQYLSDNYSDDAVKAIRQYAKAAHNAREQQKINEAIDERMANDWLYATVGANAQRLATDIFVKPVAGGVSLWNGIHGNTDPYATTLQRLAAEADYIGESIARDAYIPTEVPLIGGASLSSVYQNAYSIGENVTRTAVSKAVGIGASKIPGVNLSKEARSAVASGVAKTLDLAIVSGGVFNDTYRDALLQGYDPGAAMLQAIGHAVNESLFEKWSLEKLKLFSDATVIANKKDFLKQMMKGAFVEGSEEFATEYANQLFDAFFTYDYSDFKAFKDAYDQKNGSTSSELEAFGKFQFQIWQKAGEAFVGGALSGLVLGTTGNYSAYQRGQYLTDYASKISDTEYQRMLPTVEEMAKIFPYVSERLTEASQAGENVKRGFVAEFSDAMNQDIRKSIESAKTVDDLNTLMDNSLITTNGVLNEDTIKAYNAKMVELGKEPTANYETFQKNRDLGASTTFTELLGERGKANEEVLQARSEYAKAYLERKKNDSGENIRKEKEAREIYEQRIENAEDMVQKFAIIGKTLESPEMKPYIDTLGLERVAKIVSDTKAINQKVEAPKRAGVVKFVKQAEINRILGKESIGHVSEVTMEEINMNKDYRATYDFAMIMSKLTGQHYGFFKSDRSEKQKNGAYDPNTGITLIDLESGRTGRARATGSAIAHEFVHEARNKNEQLYQNLKAFVMNDLGDSWGDYVKKRMEQFGLSEDVAEEEVVAEACQNMLKNSEVFRRYAIADYNGAKTLRSKLAAFLNKLRRMARSVFKGNIDTNVTQAISDLEGLQKEFDKVLEAVIKMPSANDTEAVKEALADKENIVDEIVKNEDGQMEIAKVEGGKKILYSETTYNNGGRSALVDALKDQGYNKSEIDAVVGRIDRELKSIKELGQFYATKSFDKLAKNLEADITISLADEKKLLDEIESKGIVDQEVINSLRAEYQQTVYAYVPNGDYALNIDLQLSCKKRIAYETIINMMLETGIMNDVRMNGELIGEINTILAAHEFETQCLGCFVESRRLQMQKWAETIAAEWNQQVTRVTGKKFSEKLRMFPKNGKSDRDQSFEAHKIMEDAIKSGAKERSDSSGGIVLKSKAVYDKMGELIEFDPKHYGKFLSADDVLTAKGIEAIRRFDDGNLFSIVKQRYGTASPKIVQGFNPYNSEVLKLTFESVKKMTGKGVTGAEEYRKIAQQNLTQEDLNKIDETIDEYYSDLTGPDREAQKKEMITNKIEHDAIRQYMLDIGGNRIQSFSDFMIENVFDMFQLFHDFAVRDYSMHGYTKEQICLRLFGMTGAKWNGSWISHNISQMGKEYSGLMPYTAENAKNGITVEVDGEKYVIQFDDYERHVREKSFIQSIGFKDAIAIMLDPRYADNVGTITIGFSDKHIRAMLNSPYFRMVIPYHASGMIPGFAELVGADTYNDYTDYQNTTPKTAVVYKDGKKVGEYQFAEKKKKTGFHKESGDYVVKHNGEKIVIKFDTGFEFNEALQRLGDARAAADEYIAWCGQEHEASTGNENYTVSVVYAPKFSNSKNGYDFTKERNYYKLLEDFNVYNSREEIINGVSVNARQGGVKMLYPGDVNLSAEELAQYRKDLEQTGLFSAAETDKYVKKAQMTFDELIKGELEGRNVYYEKVFNDKNVKETFEEIKTLAYEKYKRSEQTANNREEYLASQTKAQKAKKNANEKLLKAPEGTYRDNGRRFSLRSVDAVEPSTDKWKQTHDTEEAMRIAAEHGVKMWDVSADYSGVANATQMAASYTSEKMLGTTNTYKKVFEHLGKDYKGRILDASSGMGYGTRLGRDRYGLDITDIEPYPHENRYQFLSDQDAYTQNGKDIVVTDPRHPDYMDYEELDRMVKSGEVEPFDFIISNAVLNVLPQDLRDSLVQHMGDLLAENGQMFINVRKVDEIRSLANNPKNVKLGDHEAVESNNGNYQYGFSEPELIAYIQDALGDGYIVVDGRKEFGTSSPTVIVTKKTADAKFSTREQILARNDVKWVDDKKSIKNQLRDNLDTLKNMQDYADVEYFGEGEQELRQLMMEEVKRIGGEIISRDGMSFKFDKNSIKQIVNHAKTFELRAAALAAPFVAKKGVLIAGQKNHDGNPITSLTFAAPIIINGERIMVGVAVHFDSMGRAHAANIVTESGGDVTKKITPRGQHVAHEKSHVTYTLTRGANNSVAQGENGVKYATRESEYMAAVESGDMETAQRMVDEKAYKKNYIAAAWHGTPNGGFTEFGGTQTRNGAKAPGVIWFAEEKEHADVYRAYPGNWPKAENPQTYHVFLNVGEWADIGNGRVEALDYSRNGNGEASKDLKNVAKQIAYKTQWKHRNESETARARKIANRLTEIARDISADFVWQVTETTEFADLCKAEGLNSVVAWESHKGVFDEKPHMVKTWGVFDPSQIKSADPVVYDDNGEVIPLEERFNKDNKDIRFSSHRGIANSESEMIIEALKGEGDEDQKQSVKAYAKAYQELQAMEKESLQYSLDLKNASPSEREVLYKKLLRINRAITNKTRELTEMRNQRVLRDVLINEWNKKLDDLEWTNELTYQQTKRALERKYGSEITALRQKSQSKQKAIRDRYEINRRKKNIEKKTKELMDRILHGTEKKHIPSILVNPIVEMLDAIDYWTPAEEKRYSVSSITKKSESLRERFLNFKQAIDQYQEAINNNAKMIDYMFDEDFLQEVQELCNSVHDIKNVNDMNVEEITDLDHVLTTLNHLISRGNKMIVQSHYKTLEESIGTTQRELEPRPDVKKTAGSLRQRLNAGMADTYAFGEYAGEGARQIVDMLSEANEKRIRQIRQVTEFASKTLEGTGFEKWKNEKETFKTEEGKEITMTVPQMMELYLLNKREQARNHIYGEGIRVESKEGKFTNAVKVTEDDVNQVIEFLKRNFPTAVKVADELQKFGATVLTDWGNEASNLLWGISKFTDENYWQIRSDTSYMKEDKNLEQSAPENASLYRLQSLGRTKAVNPNANNAIKIGDVFDTFLQTVDDMTAYSSILPATTDALRWFNSVVTLEDGRKIRVKKLLQNKLGTDMTKVFTESIKALNGGITHGNNSLEGLVGKLMGNAKAAAVAGNLRVVLQQPTAYTRAYSVMEAKYLDKALTMKPAVKEMQEHSAIGWWKSQGFFSNGLAPSLRKLILNDSTVAEKITEKTLLLAGLADDITWGTLWNAAKLKVEDTQKDLKKGSPEYFKAIEKLHSYVINQTQVVDTPLTKALWMRGGGAGKSIAALYTAFQNEPMKTYSMVSTALDKALRGEEGGKKILARALMSFALNAVVNSLAQAVADAARDDDKTKSYWEKYLEKFRSNAFDNANPLTYIPVIKEAWSMKQGFSNNRLDLQAVQNSINAWNELQRIVNRTSTKTLFGQVETVAKAVSSWTGIPLTNVMRTFNSIGNLTGIDIFRRKDYTNKDLARNIVVAAEDGDMEDVQKYSEQLLKRYDGDETKFVSAVAEYLADNSLVIEEYAQKYIEDPTTITDAIDALGNYFSEEVITKAVRKYANNQGDDVGNKTLAKGTSLYTSNDLNRALENGSIVKAQEIINDINEAYASVGSKTTAKDAVTDYWKPKYLAASGAERDKIARMLYRLKNNGQQMYSSKDLQRWAKDANK